MYSYSKQTKEELLRNQLLIQGQEEDIEKYLECGEVEDAEIFDDSLANIIRIIATGTEEEYEQLLILLTFTCEKLRWMMKGR